MKYLKLIVIILYFQVTQKEKEEDNLIEMSQGLPLAKTENDSDSEDNDGIVKSINPPTKNVKKTNVQRRKLKERRELQHQKKKEKVEKKKVADIYHLNQLSKQISKKQKHADLLQEKRLKLKAKKELEPKVLSRHKFEPAEQEFQLGEELSGNLRNAQPAGNLLKDRYKSLQQRNIVAPGTLVL